MPKSSILVVHASDALQGALERVLESEGHDVARCVIGARAPRESDEGALELAMRRHPTLVLVEADAGCENILEPLRHIGDVLSGGFASVPTVVLTSSASEEALARKLGAAETFCKPFRVEDLLDAIDRLIQVPVLRAAS